MLLFLKKVIWCVAAVAIATGAMHHLRSSPSVGEQSVGEGPLLIYGFACLAFLIYIGMIVLHEAAHALLGFAVGIRIKGIALGTGQRLVRLQFDSFYLDIHLVPRTGIYLWQDSAGIQRWRKAVMIAAGPALHAIIIVLIATAFRFTFDPHFAASTVIRGDLIYGLFWINIWFLVNDLTPHKFQRNAQVIKSDGAQLWELYRTPAKLPQNPQVTFSGWQIQLNGHSNAPMGGAQTGNIQVQSDSALELPILELPIRELLALVENGRWSEFQLRSRRYLRTLMPTDWRQSAPVAAWLAIANVLVNEPGDLEEVDALTRQFVETQSSHEVVFLARALRALTLAEDRQAESLIAKASSIREKPARALAAQLQLELAKRCGDTARRERWEAEIQTVDPQNKFKPRWNLLPIVTMPAINTR